MAIYLWILAGYLAAGTIVVAAGLWHTSRSGILRRLRREEGPGMFWALTITAAVVVTIIGVPIVLYDWSLFAVQAIRMKLQGWRR